MSRASFRRKSSAVSLCKSIESAIKWFLIHHEIIFITIHNPAVYLSGARVSISPTLVPRLTVCLNQIDSNHFNINLANLAMLILINVKFSCDDSMTS